MNGRLSADATHVDAVDALGRPVDLSTLAEGEALVRVLRGTLRYPPNHAAIGRSNRRLANWHAPQPGQYRSRVTTNQQRECLEGAP